jgi:RNA polymerase sigma-70 factor (ECF subfamily)
LRETEIARDAVMDIYANLTEKVKHYEILNFNTWLYSVAKNHCLHILQKNERTIFVNFEDSFVENEPLFTLNDESQNDEELSALNYCMERLPVEQETGIRLFYLEEKSYADVAEITGFELKQVKSYIQNGKRNLKICIEKNN